MSQRHAPSTEPRASPSKGLSYLDDYQHQRDAQHHTPMRASAQQQQQRRSGAAYPFSPLIGVGPPAHPSSQLNGWDLNRGMSGSGGLVGGVPLFPAPVWDPSRPFSFARRVGRLDWEGVLGLDLGRVVAERDLAALQDVTQGLVEADIRQDEVAYFEGESGVANSLHLFRLWQLTAEALLHVQAFLLRSLQAKEGAVASTREKYAAKLEAERVASTALKARLGSAQAELRQARATIAGYERERRGGQPVAYLTSASPAQPHAPAAITAAQYPGEVFTCLLCHNAFMAPHYLAQHYQRRHPGYGPPMQQQYTAPKPVVAAEEKEPAPYQPPQQPRFDAAALTASLRSELSAEWSRRRLEDHQRLLGRLSSLERLLADQFADQVIPANMEQSQRRIYEALVREIETIKAELAREAHINQQQDAAWAPPTGTPHWSIIAQQQQQQPQPSPSPSPPPPPVAVKISTPSPTITPPVPSPGAPAPAPVPAPLVVAPVDVTEPAAARPTPLAVPSPANSNPAYSPSPRSVTPPPAPRPRTPPPAIDPASLGHLPRSHRIRAALLARDGAAAYTPFEDLPWLQSRYAKEDWAPSPQAQLEELVARVEQLVQPDSAPWLAAIEAEMHSMESAADSYNSLHATVEGCNAAQPELEWMRLADQHLDERTQFLPVWEQLLRAKEERDAQRDALIAAEKAERERIEAAQRAEAEQAAAIQRAKEVDSRARAQASEEKASEHERMVQEQRRMLQQHEFARSQSQSRLPQPTPSPTSAALPSPSRSYRGGGGPLSTKEGMLSLDTSTPSNAAYASVAVAAAFASPQPVSTWVPYGSTKVDYAAPTPRTMRGQGIMSTRNSETVVGESGEQLAMQPPLSLVRPEGYVQPSTPLPTIMPRTPRTASRPSKVALAVLTPSARQNQQQQLGPSLSSSFNSSAAQSFGSNNSFGGASIMQRSMGAAGGLTHISEGGSLDESSALASSLRSSRRNSIEQEGKYEEGNPLAVPVPIPMATVAPRPVIPRTELDEEFEAIISPRKVVPRTQPPLILSTPSSPALAQATAAAAAAPTVAAGFMAPASTPSALQLGRAPLTLDRQTSQPGRAFSYAGVQAQTPGPGAPTPGPGAAAATPGSAGVYNIGGHGFHFGFPKAGGAGGIAEGEEALDESDEFPMSQDVRDSKNEATAAAAKEESRRKEEATERARREEEEEFGVPSVLQRKASNSQQQQQAQPQQQQSQRRAQLNDSLDETITLADEPPRAVGAAAAAAAGRPRLVPHPSSDQLLHDQDHQLPPQHARGMNMQVDATAANRAAAAQAQQQQQQARSGELTPAMLTASANRSEVQPFTASPSASFSSAATQAPQLQPQQPQPSQQQFQPQPTSAFAQSSQLQQPLMSSFSSSANAIQAFSPMSSPAASLQSSPQPQSQQAQPQQQAPQRDTQPTFLSDFGDDDDEFPKDDFHQQPAAAAFASGIARPSNASMSVVRSDDDEEAEVLDFENEGEIYGRPLAKKGVGVIAPGSVSNARAQLLGSGFFAGMSPAAGAATPSMATLKAAKAAREGVDASGLDSVSSMHPDPDGSSPTSLMSPTLSRPKVGARKNAARTARPMFSPHA